jgi:hypothetical protein
LSPLRKRLKRSGTPNGLDMTQSSELMADHLSVSDVLPEIVKGILNKGVECRFEAKGHSMSPFIKNGDILTIAPSRNHSPSIGDVVAFIQPENEKLIIHRVVKKRNSDYYVKGDNGLETDGLIHGTNILGVVKKVERSGEKVRIGLGSERFLIALLTRTNLLLPVLRLVRRIFRPIARIFFP